MALPNTYKQVEYIQSSATNPGDVSSSGQYIDTLVTINKNIKVEIDMQFTSLAVQSRLFGGLYDSGSSGITFGPYINGSTQWARATANGLGNWQTTNVSANTNRNKFILDNSTYQILNSSGTSIYNASNSSIISNSDTWTIPLLASKDRTANKVNRHSSAKLYGCKIWDNGTLVRDFVPVIRKSDNKPGLYDLVNDVFYTNAGTGEFTYKKYPEFGKITHIYLGTNLIRPSNLPKSFYYDFTNSSVAAIGQDWQITNPGNIVYDTNKGLGRTSSAEYSLNMYNCINMSNVTKKVTFKIGVVTRASSGGVYGGTINVNNGTSSLWIHDNSQNYMTGDINGRYESNYWYRSTGYSVSGYDIVEWNFENLTMKCTVLGDGQRTVNIQSGQLDTIKTFTNVYLGGSTMWWKDILIEWE